MPYKTTEITRKYYSIGETSQELGIRSSTIRFWCKELDIKPSRSHVTNNRRFTPEDLQVLKKVKELSLTGFLTIKGIKEKIKEGEDFGAWLL